MILGEGNDPLVHHNDIWGHFRGFYYVGTIVCGCRECEILLSGLFDRGPEHMELLGSLCGQLALLLNNFYLNKTRSTHMDKTGTTLGILMKSL